MRYLNLIILAALMPISAHASDDPVSKPQILGETIDYTARHEDTFIHLARDHDVGFVELRAANPGVDPWLPGAGEPLVLPTAHLLPEGEGEREGIIINIPEMRLYVFREGEQPLSFPLGIGREGLETPKGQTTIVRKADGPTWRPTERMRKEDPDLEAVVPPGPDNPLGTHALYLGWPQYLIHGTNKPFGIGRRISSGCIRMYPEDITQLFEMIPVGTKVTVIDQPVKMAWIDDKLMIEAHPSEQQSIEVEEQGAIHFDPIPEEDVRKILDLAGSYYMNIDWAFVRQIYGLRLGYPIQIIDRTDPRAFSVGGVQDYKNQGQKHTVPTRQHIEAEAQARLKSIYATEG